MAVDITLGQLGGAAQVFGSPFDKQTSTFTPDRDCVARVRTTTDTTLTINGIPIVYPANTVECIRLAANKQVTVS